MKTLYIDCGMGAAGDMLTAALLELLPDPDAFISELNAVGIPGVGFERYPAEKCGIRGTQVSVRICGEEETEHPHPVHDHSHAVFHGIEHIVSHLAVSAKVRTDVLNIYASLAEAESIVHGVPVAQIHFHEVGALDAVADVTAVCMLMERLAPEEVIVSPIHVGSGQVRCAHGILPVPAPATALLLRGIPSYGGEVRGELCTPTGAALLRHFVRDFGPQPLLRVERLGYGCGSKEFPGRANCLRAMLGETEERREDVLELSCNLDDMTPEALGFALEELLRAGALDAYTLPLGMKKSRPGVMLSCLCREEQREELLRLLFRHTSTLGVREARLGRYVLEREAYTVDTPHGPVRLKRSVGYGVSREKPEYEDLARIAREQNCSLAEAAQTLPPRREP